MPYRLYTLADWLAGWVRGASIVSFTSLRIAINQTQNKFILNSYVVISLVGCIPPLAVWGLLLETRCFFFRGVFLQWTWAVLSCPIVAAMAAAAAVVVRVCNFCARHGLSQDVCTIPYDVLPQSVVAIVPQNEENKTNHLTFV